MSTVTVVATVESTTTPQRVRLDVTDIGSSPALFATTVTRLDPDGRVVPVRTLDGNPLPLATSGATRVGILYDYEMPYGSAVSYSTMESPTSTSSEVTVIEPRVWLIHPGVPALSMPVEFRIDSFSEESFTVNQGVFHPMGRRTPVVVSDGTRHSSQGSMTVGTQTLAELASLRALLADGSPLLLNSSASSGLGIDTRYVSISDVRERRLTNIGTDPQRDVELPFTVVDRPAGGSQSARTYADLLAYATYADLRLAYATYFDVLAGP